jgi:hypothetical protein
VGVAASSVHTFSSCRSVHLDVVEPGLMSWRVTTAPPLSESARRMIDTLDADTAAAMACGVIRSGLASRLWSRASVEANLSAHRWARHAHDVLVLHNGPLDVEQTRWVALLAAPPGAVLGGLTALTEAGFRTTQRPTLTVVGPHRSRRPGWGHADYWVSRQLAVDVVRTVGSPPRTSPGRSCLDVASRAPTDLVARGTVLAVVQQRLATPVELTGVVGRFPTLPRRALIRESIADALGGIESVPEHEFDRLRARWGLPEPTRQSVVQRRDGRYYLDAEWRRYRARCEIHGAPHFDVGRWSTDLERQNDLVLARGSMLVFTSFSIRHRPDTVGRQVAELLRQGGWHG